MKIQLEHANIAVPDIEAMVRFLQTAFPDFAVRGEGQTSGRRWLHVGNQETYIALEEADPSSALRKLYSPAPGLNHLAYVVDQLDALHKRLSKAGYEDTTPKNNHPHRRRVYFNAPDGHDWEFVEYSSSLPNERNDYTL